ncbi:hypothetical protein B2G71_05610 [Novosphingobium sp. PC22D]|uniref:hypothetical protein n=1 Tax=Novosphingobium sp. PC22D TaxID=1962403 RepID=UPI000BF07878|nr:hypothetical protein [Novosphingobium sp. PC22D]PEQ13789.1 hypothetical protein B2G71_05610 [Novosphingobium sp. PC22D]
MYDFIEQPVANLDRSGRFLVWATRGWARAIAARRCPPRVLMRGFNAHGLMDMLPHFHLAMVLLNLEGRDKLAVAPLEHRDIVEHEAVLLALWRDVAFGREARVRATLALLVNEEAVTPLLRALNSCSAEMTHGGFEPSALHIHASED